jgi:hypothetical protein
VAPSSGYWENHNEAEKLEGWQQALWREREIWTHNSEIRFSIVIDEEA